MAIKLTSEEKKKIAVGITLFIVFVISYYFFLLTPAKNATLKAAKDLKVLLPKIAAAKKQIEKVKAMELDAPEVKLIIDQVNSMIPADQPDTWFPPRMQEILKSCGVVNPVIVKSTEWPDKEIPDYKRLNWELEIPKITFYDACVVLQTLENQEPLFEILSIRLEANDSNPEFQNLKCTIRNLIRKQ